MESQARPFGLMVIVTVYFLIGVSALLDLFINKSLSPIGLLSVVLAYGVFYRSPWALFGLKLLVSLQTFLLLCFLMLQLLFSGVSLFFVPEFTVFGFFDVTVPLSIVNGVLVIGMLYQLCIVFSDEAGEFTNGVYSPV